MNDKTIALNRRTFLRGAGVALALPWLETFAAASPAKDGSSKDATPKRFLSVYHPDGVGLPLKTDPAWKDWSWFPRGGEKDFELTKVLDVLGATAERHHDLFGLIPSRSKRGSWPFEC